MKKNAMTLNELFDLVWRDHWSQKRFQLSGHARVVRANYEAHIKLLFGHLKLNAVTRTKVKKWHSDMVHISTTANRCLEVLSKLYSFAIDREVFVGMSPCYAVKSHTERKRRRYATETELAKIGEILATYPKRNLPSTLFLLTLLFTGARPRSIERARWEDLTILDEGFALLTFDGKTSEETGEKETVLIPPQVMDKIQELPRRADGIIFGVKMPRELWSTVREKAGCPDLWARDFRRTFATVGMSNEVKMDTISELLNHKSVQTTKIYAKLNNKARVEAVKHIASKMDTLLKKNKVSNF